MGPVAAERAWPSPRAGWYAVFVLSLTLLVNFLDRGIIALLVPQIKADLLLTDTQLSLIMGFAFVMFYMIAGLPIARHADKGNRRNLIALGMALWGGATALCGFARSFGALFAFRVGVGVGEACTGPASYSLLGDYFPPAKLPRAIAALNFGFIAGNGLAILIGGTLVSLLASAGHIALPFFGELRVWQAAFIIVGIPGLLVSLLMLTVREPERRQLGAPPPLREVMRFVIDHNTVYLPLILGISLNTIVAVGHASWGPAFYMRTYHWDVARVGLVSGLTFLLVMPFGVMIGGTLAERWSKAGKVDANMRVTLLALALSFPFMLVSPLMPNGWLAAGCGAIGLFFTSWLFGPQNAAIQTVTPGRMRGMVTALVLFGFNVIGYGLGPTVLALFTDYVFHDPNQIRYAMVACYAIISPIAFLILWLGLKPYGRAVAAIHADEFKGAPIAKS
jgi:MFS family permease